MKLEAPKLRQARLQRQEIWRRARATSPTLRGIFPRVELLKIELKFVDHMAHTPADQTHTMHPAAQAFFSFPCPYADCDGAYDLAAAVKEVVASSAHQCEGDVHCTGHRVRDGNNGQACGLKLHYVVKVHLRRASTAARETADASPG
jgi:hypothetical protein